MPSIDVRGTVHYTFVLVMPLEDKSQSAHLDAAAEAERTQKWWYENGVFNMKKV